MSDCKKEDDFALGCLSVRLRHRMYKKGIKNWFDFEEALKRLVCEAREAGGHMKDGKHIVSLFNAIEPFATVNKLDRWADLPNEPNANSPVEEYFPCCHPDKHSPDEFANRCQREQMLVYGFSPSVKRTAWGYVYGFLIGVCISTVVWHGVFLVWSS